MTFLQPMYLIGLSLISIPIIIHLWFRKKLKRIPFSHLKFLKKAEAKRLGWLRLKELLILALRCLFVVFLFLSLAKPQLTGGLFVKNRLASVFLILDNSYSMGYGENFQRAKEFAYQLISFYSPNSEFFVIPLCPQNENYYWTNGKSASEIIKKIELSYTAGTIEELAVRYPAVKTKYPLEYIYIGDGQETNFKDFPEKIIATTNFYWLKIPTGSNVGVTKVSLKDPIGIALDNYQLIANLTNFSSEIWQGRISLKAGDYILEKDCEIQADQSLALEFLLPVSITCGEAKLSGDSLLVDNDYFFSKSVPQKLKILIVGKDEFLRPGLRPSDKLNIPFEVETINNLSNVDLRKFRMIILNGVHDLSEGDRIKLDNFLSRDDTGIICFLVDNVGDNLRSFIGRCAKVENQVLPKGYATLDWVDYEYPAFTIFKGSASLKGIKFYQFQKIIVNKGTVAKLGDYPLIAVNNNLAIVATQFNTQTTDIIYKSSFVPLLYRLITSLVYRFPDKEFYVGNKLNTHKILKGPNDEYLTDNEFSKPGFYTLNHETLGINVIPEEGNLKTIGEEIAKSLNVQTIDLTISTAGGDLTSIFLLLALVAIFFELILLSIH